ncbi:MAG TPA: hypothetical protein VND93_20695 [Myxococcales bacterium]|nr:hypothetical protein [Myxococcales bacterium]
MLRHLVPLALAAAMTGSTCNQERSSGPPTSESPAPTGPGAKEVSCVDQWLEKNNLNEYGDPKQTMYAGGNPLFDERTGQTTDRLAYIYQHHPDAKAACHQDSK